MHYNFHSDCEVNIKTITSLGNYNLFVLQIQFSDNKTEQITTASIIFIKIETTVIVITAVAKYGFENMEKVIHVKNSICLHMNC